MGDNIIGIQPPKVCSETMFLLNCLKKCTQQRHKSLLKQNIFSQIRFSPPSHFMQGALTVHVSFFPLPALHRGIHIIVFFSSAHKHVCPSSPSDLLCKAVLGNKGFHHLQDFLFKKHYSFEISPLTSLAHGQRKSLLGHSRDRLYDVRFYVLGSGLSIQVGQK